MELNDEEVTQVRTLLAGTGTLPGLRVYGTLRIENPIAGESALFVHQMAPATAAQIYQPTTNPALKLRTEDSCGLEIVQGPAGTGRDVIDAKIGDARVRQTIAHQLCIGRDPRDPAPPIAALGGICFVDPADPKPSPEFFLGIKQDAIEALHIGVPEARDRSVRIRTGTKFIDFEAGGVLQMRIGAAGVWIRKQLKDRP